MHCMLGDTGNKRAVRILLECILVSFGDCYCYNTLVVILVLKCLRCVKCFSIEILSLIILHNSVKKIQYCSSVPLVVVLKFVKRNCNGSGL